MRSFSGTFLRHRGQGHPARPHDRAARRRRRHPVGNRIRARPDPAGQPRPAAGRRRLPRARELPARPHHRRRAHRRVEAARDCAHRRRGAGDRLRLYRAAARKPGAARRHRRRRQSEELDRPARRVHPRHRRRDARLRPHRGRLSRPALCRDFSPRTFPVLVREGSRLSQIRFRHGHALARRRGLARIACARAAGRQRQGRRRAKAWR